MDRVRHLTNKIYREMLCITSHEGMTDISIDELEHLQVSSSSWTSQQRIVLSWDLLSWISVEGGIPCSFTNFITTPELSGPLYISPDIYHTQITEYSLKTNFLRNYSRWASLSLYIEHFPSPNCYNFVRPSSFSCSVKRDWSFMEHLPRALPTENDFSSTSINSFGMPCTWLLSKTYAWYTGSYYQVAWGLCLNECNRQRQIPSDCFFFLCIGTWFRATGRLVRAFQGWNSSTQKKYHHLWLNTFDWDMSVLPSIMMVRVRVNTL